MATLPTNSSASLNNNSVEEETIIVLEASDISGSLDRCSKSLLGRLFANRPFSGGTIELALSSIWWQPKSFKVIDNGGNMFQFFFSDEKDLIRIERCAPWLFKNYILNLKGWKKDFQIVDTKLTKGEVHDEKWGDWVRSEQGGRREIVLKENSNPNSQQQAKRTPIVNHNQEDAEVISKAIPPSTTFLLPNPTILRPTNTIKPDDGLEGFVFTSINVNSQSSSP
ncbi:hypothetical protein PIB30_045057 [Stylosanthes scabra]|uniref:DUF4283 domain-containing protein n=1 Tax=Stylosanthes scabra TaxID=79078 RepID=A0ABU6UJA2_9FABA|nr:hypothetical protein [Stylosanthes scabra]